MGSYIQIPPDSTGKKVYTQLVTESGVDYYAQGVAVIDQTTPSNSLRVDPKGAAYFRFAEGEPKLDPYGNLKMSRSVVLGSYDHSSDSQDDLYTITESGSATSTFDSDSSRVILSTDTASDSFVQRTMNRYHYYNAGTGTQCLLSIQCGDLGKDNNTRRWGYYDDEDGVFFQLSGSILSIGVRSSVGGTVLDTIVPQSEWNVDTLDGNGISSYEIDVTEVENYWLNIQWPGSVRFGLFNDTGDRLECHKSSNEDSLPLQTCTLPVRVENFNTGITLSTSELFEYAMSVYHDNPVDYTFWRYADMCNSSPVTITTETPVMSIRPKLIVNSGINRVPVYPQILSVYSTGTAKMNLVYDVILSGSTFGLEGESTLEGDISATGYSIGDDGYNFISEYVNSGITNIDLCKYYELNDEGIMIDADENVRPVLTFSFTRLTDNETSVHTTLTYRELR
jgi:hypothetical protein